VGLVRHRERTVRARAALLGTTALVALSATMFAGDPAHAQSTWLGITANYRQAANWNNATPPLTAGRSAIFSSSGSTTVNIPSGPGPISPDSWTFATNTQNYTFNGADVNFSVGGPAGGIISNANAGQIITIKNNIGQSVTGVTVEVLGNSTLKLSGTNTYSGGTIVLGGIIQATNNSSFGTGLITLDAATLMGDGVHNINIGNPIGVNNVFAPASTVDNAGAKLTLSGTVFGNGGLKFIDSSGSFFTSFNPSRTVLSGSNTYTGGTTISGTIVQANNNGAFGTGDVTLDAGTVQTKGTNLTLANNFILANTIGVPTFPSGSFFGGFLDANGATLRITGNIAGPGGLETVDSTGGFNSVILTGTNSYTGGTIVCSCSTLQLGTNNLQGSIIGPIDNLGTLRFVNADTSGITTLKNESGALTVFSNSTNAGTMTINNLFDPFFGPGTLRFHDFASAGNATINNYADSLFFSPFGSTVAFSDNSTAGKAIINNIAATFGSGKIKFNDFASAGNATINNAGFGNVIFADQSKAGFATITNNDAGVITFKNHSSAENATIVNSADGLSGGVAFLNHSTADKAFITTNLGALTLFADHADGRTAQFLANAGSTVDFSQTSGLAADGKISVGSFAGAGDYYLGGNQVTIGGNNLSRVVDGTINDGASPLLTAAFCGCGLTFNTGASLVKVGTGTLTLNGTNTYTGPTTVNGGILSVNGSIVKSSGVTVNAGGTLAGNGFVPTTIINGGTLSPGNSIGTITVSGGLSFVGAGNYLVEVSPSAADRTNVTGAATLTGTVQALFLAGSYAPKSYVILSANGGLTGTFGTVSLIGVPAALSASITYTPTDVVLNLTSAFTQVTGLNVNQAAVASALDKAFNSGVPVNPSFATLFGLPASVIPGVLTQLAGEIGTAAPTAGFQTIDQFLNLMLDPFLETRLGDGSVQGRALSFAPQSSVQAALPAELLSYNAMIPKAPPMVAPDRRWTVWGAAFGASGRFSGDAVIGSNTLKVSTGSFAAGIDYRVSPDTVLGLAVSGGAYNYGLDALGSGRGNVLQAGLYGSTRFAEHAYLSAALAYGRHDLATDRSVTVGGVFDRLSADFNTNSWGGRVETGYRFAMMNGLGVTPFAAVQAQRFETGAYAERDLTGLAAFALNYAAQTTTDTRSELGARFDYRMMTDYGALLTWRARAAWGHEFATERSIAASFQALPGFGFTVIGAAQASDVALVSAGAELKLRNGISLSARFDGEFAGRAQVYGATGALRVNW
jgi:autotransporter-associated beta strand protein